MARSCPSTLASHPAPQQLQPLSQQQAVFLLSSLTNQIGYVCFDFTNLPEANDAKTKKQINGAKIITSNNTEECSCIMKVTFEASEEGINPTSRPAGLA